MIHKAKRLDTVKEYYFSQKLREIAQLKAQGLNIINLGIGSPDLLPPPEVTETLKSTIDTQGANQYQSYKGIPQLRQAWANWYKQQYNVSLNPDSDILPLMGSKEGIMHISMAFLNAGETVLVPDPGYPTYSSVTQLLGGKLLKYNLIEQNYWLPDFTELEELVTTNTKIIWVNYPHMPTGQKGNADTLKQLIRFAQKHQILLINDNPYSFINNTEPISIFNFEGARSVALELNSLSKSHNMAGWRQGVVVGAAKLIEPVLSVKSNFDSGMYLPAQMAATKALSTAADWYKKLNQIYSSRQQYVFQIFDKLGCSYQTEQMGMFVWAKIPNKYDDSFQLTDEILENFKVFITPGAIFGNNGKQYVRISLSNSEKDLQAVIERLNSNN